MLRTATLTVFYSDQSGLRSGDERRAGQLTRAEATEGFIIAMCGDTASGDSATFDGIANTVLMEGGVTVTRTRAGEDPLKPDVVRSERLKVDLTTGMLRFESDGAPTSQQPTPDRK